MHHPPGGPRDHHLDNPRPGSTRTQRPARLREADCSIEEFVSVVDQTTDPAAYPLAARVVQNVLVYDSEALLATAGTGQGQDDVAAELVRALTAGPGVVVLENAFPAPGVVDRVTAAFDAIIADERTQGGPAGDHFATAGRQQSGVERAGNLAVRDPDAFVDYYSQRHPRMV